MLAPSFINSPSPLFTSAPTSPPCSYLLAMLVCVPFARLNLDDNMSFQWLSAVAQLAFSFVFAAQFIFNILPGSPNYCEGNGPGRTPFVGIDITQVGERTG